MTSNTSKTMIAALQVSLDGFIEGHTGKRTAKAFQQAMFQQSQPAAPPDCWTARRRTR